MVASSAPASSGSSSRAISGVPEPLLERRQVPPSPTSSAVTSRSVVYRIGTIIRVYLNAG